MYKMNPVKRILGDKYSRNNEEEKDEGYERLMKWKAATEKFHAAKAEMEEAHQQWEFNRFKKKRE